MIGTTISQTNAFTLELPKGDAAFFRALAKKMGWTVKKSSRKLSAYERSLDDAAHGRINEYASADDFFKKMGI